MVQVTTIPFSLNYLFFGTLLLAWPQSLSVSAILLFWPSHGPRLTPRSPPRHLYRCTLVPVSYMMSGVRLVRTAVSLNARSLQECIAFSERKFPYVTTIFLPLLFSLFRQRLTILNLTILNVLNVSQPARRRSVHLPIRGFLLRRSSTRVASTYALLQ